MPAHGFHSRLLLWGPGPWKFLALVQEVMCLSEEQHQSNKEAHSDCCLVKDCFIKKSVGLKDVLVVKSTTLMEDLC